MDAEEALERRRMHAELERLFQPYAQQLAEALWGKPGARADRALVALHGFDPCPRCWSGDEECDACDGLGLLRRG